MIKIESRVLGPVATNCYLIINKDNNESIIVDPADSPESIYDMVVRSGSKPQAILLTHGHFDHMHHVTRKSFLLHRQETCRMHTA